MELVSHNMDKYKDLEKDVIRDQEIIKKTRKYTLIFGFTMVLVLVIDNYITRLFIENRNELIFKLLFAGLIYSWIRTGLTYKRMNQAKRGMHKILLHHPHLSRMV